jgi:hypothetical protein
MKCEEEWDPVCNALSMSLLENTKAEKMDTLSIRFDVRYNILT